MDVAAPIRLRNFAPLPHGAAASQRLILESAFASMRRRWPVMMLPIAGAVLAAGAGNDPVMLAWAVASAAFLVGQRALSLPPGKINFAPAGWAGRYVALAWAQAALIGLGGAIVARHGDIAPMALMAGPIGYVATHTVERAAFGPAARISTMMMLAPFAAASLAAATPVTVGIALITLGQTWLSLRAIDEGAPPVQAAPGSEPASPTGATHPRTVTAAQFQGAFGYDGATGLPTKPRFLTLLAQESGRAVQGTAPLSLILLQCDDTAAQGEDRTLADMAARRLQSMLCRPGDILASLSNGRFAVLLPFTDAMGCATVARKLQHAMQKDGESHQAAVAETTLSIGMASYAGHGALEPTQLMDFAEQALIDAKRDGGGRMRRYDPALAALRPASTLPKKPKIVPEERERVES